MASQEYFASLHDFRAAVKAFAANAPDLALVSPAHRPDLQEKPPELSTVSES